MELEWALSQLYGTVRKPHSAAPEYTLYMSFYPGLLSRVLSRFDLTRCIAFVGFDLIACAACLRLCLSFARLCVILGDFWDGAWLPRLSERQEQGRLEQVEWLVQALSAHPHH